MQLQELNNRFNEVNSELLLFMACFNPSNAFCAFDKESLTCFAQFYPSKFSAVNLLSLENQAQNYIVDMRSYDDFLDLKDIGNLVKKLVETKRDIVYLLVYLLVKLSLNLLITTATVERYFSAVKFIKNRLRNRMGDQWTNDYLIIFIKKDVFDSIGNETIMQHFQNMKSRHG